MDEHGGKPLVSCIITTYKREFSMLKSAIESVRAQTYQPLEWYVVSDNAPDSEYAKQVAEGMREYPDGHLIQLPKNSGAQVARNTGILQSRGEFIACLDDDDLWTPEKIEKEMALFTDSDIGVAF
ncbi:MAG: glycosyltransferase family 2 protein, partial [Eubacteriales bacterium]|nr:glycosyltransferase family 2 protein [Eubacteriales bacterium]